MATATTSATSTRTRPFGLALLVVVKCGEEMKEMRSDRRTALTPQEDVATVVHVWLLRGRFRFIRSLFQDMAVDVVETIIEVPLSRAHGVAFP